MAKRGRPRKPNAPRYASGRINAEREERACFDERIAYRALHLAADGFSGVDPMSPLAGTLLGRLRLSNWISGQQYLAGDTWAGIVRRHSAIMGYSLGAKAPSFQMVSFGLPCGDEPTPETIGDIRDRFRLCYDALMQTSRIYGLDVRNATYAVCIENDAIRAELRYLQLGLNSLANALTVYRKSDRRHVNNVEEATCA